MPPPKNFPARNLSGLTGATKAAEPEEEPAAESEPTEFRPRYVVRELGTGRELRAINVSPGFSWKDVNAFAASLIMGEMMKAGVYLDMSEAYWPQDNFR